jgi:hypothetical protein
MKKVPFLLLVVALMLSVGFVFAATPQQKSAPAKRGVKKVHKLPTPAAPNVILYDQYDNVGTYGISSQDFEPAYDAIDDFVADDFVVPSGETWNIDEVDVQGVYYNGVGPSDSFHVFIYQDSGGLPGTNVYTGMAQAYTSADDINFVITLSPAAVLTEGTYWISVQSRMDFSAGGQWGWQDRSVLSNTAGAWQNPGDGFGTGCTTWAVKTICIGTTDPDSVFRLVGTIGPSCTYSNDFNDGILDWIEEKPTVTESGGFLNLTPLKRKAVAVADATFAPASVGTYTYDIQFVTGGIFAKDWLYVARTDKKNQLEILFKVGLGRVVVKDRLGAVLAKTKADFTFAAATPYQVVVNYDGTNVDVTINGTPVIVDFVPARTLPLANTGAAAKNDSLMIDNFCFQ